MKFIKFALLAISLVSIVSIVAQGTKPTSSQTPQLNLMPIPASLQLQSGRLAITNTFQVAVRNYSDARLQSAINRMMARLSGRTGLTLTPSLASDESHAALVIDCG